MKALSKLSDEMNAEQFSDRLNAIYNELLNLLDVDRPRAQSLICAALSFKKWDEGGCRCNFFGEEGEHAFDDAYWKRFLEWVAEKIEDVSLWKGLDEVSLGRVDNLVVSMAKYVTRCHRDYENGRVVRSFLTENDFPIWETSKLADCTRFVLKQYSGDDSCRHVVDCTEIVRIQRQHTEMCRLDPNLNLMRQTLYYDESGNDNVVRIVNGKLNLDDPNQVFVLGGLSADNAISLSELKDCLGRDTDGEVKSGKFLGDSFIGMLERENFSKLMNLIEARQWHIHFFVAQPLYYGLVDIVDSLENFVGDFELKQALFDVVRANLVKAVRVLNKFEYPDIKSDRMHPFLDALIELTNDVQTNKGVRDDRKRLIEALQSGKLQDELPFIQEEAKRMLVGDYFPFYHSRLMTFPQSRFVFDGKDDLFRRKEQVCFAYGGSEIDWRVAYSEKEPMLQLCDYVVNVIRRFVYFADRNEKFVRKDIRGLTQKGRMRLTRFKTIWKESEHCNPLLTEYVVSKKTRSRVLKCLEV